MRRLGVKSVDEFEAWLQEERTYLQSLKKEPLEETLQMEYVKALESLSEAECVLLSRSVISSE
jgi:hypothetical protein